MVPFTGFPVCKLDLWMTKLHVLVRAFAVGLIGLLAATMTGALLCKVTSFPVSDKVNVEPSGMRRLRT